MGQVAIVNWEVSFMAHQQRQALCIIMLRGIGETARLRYCVTRGAFERWLWNVPFARRLDGQCPGVLRWSCHADASPASGPIIQGKYVGKRHQRFSLPLCLPWMSCPRPIFALMSAHTFEVPYQSCRSSLTALFGPS